MPTIKLTRTTEFMGALQNVTVTGDILDDTETHVKIRLTEDTISSLGKQDWRKGDEISISQELIEAFI